MILGAGGLGCPAALALAEAAQARGLPLRLVLVDDDRVERSNLARQILFREQDVGSFKSPTAAARLRELGGEGRAPLAVEHLVERFTAANASRILAGADVLLDGTDNFETRFAANDAALEAGVPLVHGAALGFTGQLLTILPGRSACLRCLFEGPPPPDALPTCAEAGVAAPLCGVVGASMAEEAMLLLTGRPPRAASLLFTWTGHAGSERRVAVPVDRSCRCAGRAAQAS